jgi:hypothetical protein
VFIPSPVGVAISVSPLDSIASASSLGRLHPRGLSQGDIDEESKDLRPPDSEKVDIYGDHGLWPNHL